MGISRDSMHKRRATGDVYTWKWTSAHIGIVCLIKQNAFVLFFEFGFNNSKFFVSSRYELGRQPANTKISSNKTVRRVRVRGGNVKWRALRLDTGNYSWGSEAVTRKTRILDVVYNASNNELVRTQTLVKSAIVQVDAAPFKQWYLQHYGVDLGRKKKAVASATKKEGEVCSCLPNLETGGPDGLEVETEEAKKSNHVVRKLEKRLEERKLDPHVEEQFSGGRLLAAISSRPGQCGRADGYELGRQPANTKISSNKTVRRVRVRGGNVKWRALRLDTGNYSWGSEAVTRKTRILDVVYNASNNELVRTQTLVKSAIVQVDAAPFKQWYLQHYGVDLGRKKKAVASATKKEGEVCSCLPNLETGGPDGLEVETEEAKKSNHVVRKLEKRLEERKLDPHVEEQFSGGRLLAAISSRPGQCGRADGYILEGKELEFYMKKLQKKKGKGAAA
ncbi:40S ribosomal protein S8 [Artemisia annua]|uniref:40S ribosomal protein S8 n=1 Tax=Artemisia annua TaxID=35608 RepID=A0A2U1P6F0_ARTAN|nr:40S ribosomal protein S8 [Artemisia annua]